MTKRPSVAARTAGSCGRIAAAAALACLAPAPALAAGAPGSISSEAVLILQVTVLIAAGRLFGEMMQRVGQPAVMGQLLAGILLGPSVLGALWPSLQHAIFPDSGRQRAMLEAVAQLGILLLLLLTGMETDLKLVRRVGRAAISVSLAGVSLPFVAGVIFGYLLPDSLLPEPSRRLVSSLFLGTALSISSVKIVAMIVREMGFMRRNIGQVIVASAVIEDSIGWIIVAITFGIASHGRIDLAGLAQTILGTGLFLLVSLTLGRVAAYKLIRWTNDHMRSEAAVISVILLITGGMALITSALGVHTVLGAFIAGVLIGESPFLTRRIDEQLRGLIAGLFMPVFFGLAGLTADLTILTKPNLLALTAGLIGVASVGKFAGAFAGAEIGGLNRREAVALACSMNARGSTEVIVATLGLSLGLLSRDLFTMIVATAVATTLAMPPMLRHALRRLPASPEEKERLEREEFEAKGFVANLERILIAVDEGANGRFASRLAGLLAGVRGIPATVLHVGAEPPVPAAEPDEASAESMVKASADKTAAAEESELKMRPTAVEVTSLAAGIAPGTVIAGEARKGYDLLVIGIDNPVRADGGFHPQVEHVAGQFDGALSVVVGRGAHLDRPGESGVKVLLPVSGTAVSRRAAEVAVTIARADRLPITALYVASNRAERPRSWRRRLGPVTPLSPEEEAILKDVVELADRYHIPVHTAIRTETSPDDAILREARRGGYDLIVMGVNRRPGESLFFGQVAAKVLTRAKASLLFVSS